MDALLKICPTYLNISKFCNLAVSLLTVLKNVTMEPSTLEVRMIFSYAVVPNLHQKAFEVEYFARFLLQCIIGSNKQKMSVADLYGAAVLFPPIMDIVSSRPWTRQERSPPLFCCLDKTRGTTAKGEELKLKALDWCLKDRKRGHATGLWKTRFCSACSTCAG